MNPWIRFAIVLVGILGYLAFDTTFVQNDESSIQFVISADNAPLNNPVENSNTGVHSDETLENGSMETGIDTEIRSETKNPALNSQTHIAMNSEQSNTIDSKSDPTVNDSVSSIKEQAKPNEYLNETKNNTPAVVKNNANVTTAGTNTLENSLAEKMVEESVGNKSVSAKKVEAKSSDKDSNSNLDDEMEGVNKANAKDVKSVKKEKNENGTSVEDSNSVKKEKTENGTSAEDSNSVKKDSIILPNNKTSTITTQKNTGSNNKDAKSNTTSSDDVPPNQREPLFTLYPTASPMFLNETIPKSKNVANSRPDCIHFVGDSLQRRLAAFYYYMRYNNSVATGGQMNYGFHSTHNWDNKVIFTWAPEYKAMREKIPKVVKKNCLTFFGAGVHDARHIYEGDSTLEEVYDEQRKFLEVYRSMMSEYPLLLKCPALSDPNIKAKSISNAYLVLFNARIRPFGCFDAQRILITMSFPPFRSVGNTWDHYGEKGLRTQYNALEKLLFNRDIP